MLVRFISWIRSSVMTPFWLLYFVTEASLYVWAARLKRLKKLDRICWRWGRNTLRMFNVQVVVRGKENIPDAGVLFLFNHQSLMDIPVVAYALDGRPRFGAKIELFKLPFMGAGLRAMRALPITRQDRSKVIEVYREAEKRVKEGESFVLAPEGTRQAQPRIGPFKSGPFIFAINAQMPICPVVIRGAHEILEKKAILVNSKRWKAPVFVEILPTISTQGLTVEDRATLKEKAREQFVESYGRLSEIYQAAMVAGKK